MQIWDTAGQERYRSISKLYYRSANCGILCYDITSEESFIAMHSWYFPPPRYSSSPNPTKNRLTELKKNINNNIIIHIVGTKADLVNADPSKRAVPFERCLAYAAEHLGDNEGLGWAGMDACHEISAKDDTGVEEVFEVIARKLVERRQEIEMERLYGPGGGGGQSGGGGGGGVRGGGVETANDAEKKKGRCC
jgi:GTPase SAR1 family protein